MSLPLVLREMRETDRGFVFKHWLRSYQHSSWFKLMGRAYWTEHHRAIEKIMRVAYVRVAAWEEDPDIIAGFACLDAHTLHYVFVLEDFRRQGVAKVLLHGVPEDVTFTHKSRVCAELPVPEGWRFNPYAFFQ